MPGAGMQTGPDQVQFLQLLVKLAGAKRCLEVGVYTGYSALGVALALPPDGRIVACDVNEEYTSVGKRYWQRAGVADKIDLRLAPASDTLNGLIRDGRVGYIRFCVHRRRTNAAYDTYYEACLQLLTPTGSSPSTTFYGAATCSTRAVPTRIRLRCANSIKRLAVTNASTPRFFRSATD